MRPGGDCGEWGGMVMNEVKVVKWPRGVSVARDGWLSGEVWGDCRSLSAVCALL